MPDKNPAWKAQSEIADIIGVSRQLIQKHAKKKLLPAVCTEGKDKGKLNRWHQCVEDYKLEVEAKRGTKVDQISKAIKEPDNKTIVINGQNQEISIEEIENLTLKQIVERYGGIAGFKAYAETLDKIASWKIREIKYEQTRKKLVSKNPVVSSLFALINAGNKSILEYPPTVTDQLMAIANSGRKTARIEMIELQNQALSKILKGVKQEVLKGLKDVERD